MLQIFIDGKQAVLPPDLEIEVLLNNFITEERKEDATYPLTLNLELNRHIFGFPERLTNNRTKMEYAAYVRCASYLILDGIATITDINTADKEIELFISTDNSSFWGINGQKYIDELDLGYESFINETSFYNAMSHSVKEEYEYVCAQTYDENYNEPGKIIHYYNRWSAARQQLLTSSNGRQNTYVPFPRLLTIITRILNACGYAIRINDLEKIEGFKDVLIIHRRGVSPFTRTLRYNQIVPHLTLQEFFGEIERKFSVRLFVNEGNKTISIRSGANIHTPNVTDLEVYDEITKRLPDPQEEIQKNYKFFDKEIKDTYVQNNQDQLKYLVGEDKDPVSYECISTIAGIRHNREDIYLPTADPNEDQPIDLTLDYDELAFSCAKDISEFRLSVYRGFKNRAIYAREEEMKELYGYVPVVTPLPVEDCPNPISLFWTGSNGLFETFHHARVDFLIQPPQEHDLYVVPSIHNIAYAQHLFSENIVVRHQRYFVKSQKLKLSSSGIIEHQVTVIPL